MNLEEMRELMRLIRIETWIEVSLFVNGEHKDRMLRNTVPSLGDTIVIDCGIMVKVMEINHQWDNPNFIQINCVPVVYTDFYIDESKGGEPET